MKKYGKIEVIEFYNYEEVENLACYIKDKFKCRFWNALNNNSYLLIADEAIFRYYLNLNVLKNGVGEAKVFGKNRNRTSHIVGSDQEFAKKWMDMVVYGLEIFESVKLTYTI